MDRLKEELAGSRTQVSQLRQQLESSSSQVGGWVGR